MHEAEPLSLEEFLDRMACELEVARTSVAPAVRPIEDLGLDSLGVLELIVALEEMGTAVPHEAFEHQVDFADLYYWYGSSVEGSGARPLEAAVLHGPRVALRPVREADHGSLYRMATDEGGHNWRLRGLALSEPEFRRVLWEGVLVQFAVAPARGGEPIGLVQALRASPQGHAFLSVLLDAMVRGRGFGFEALALFVDHLFENFPLRRLYAEAGSFDESGLRRGAGRWYEIHARLPGQLFWRGSRWDMLVLGVERSAWRAGAGRRLHRRTAALGAEAGT